MSKMVEEKPGWCALCKSRCGATFQIEDGRLIGAGPLPEHPTGKSLCVKGRAAPEILYSSERLAYPMKRTLPKTGDDPGWTRISWDEALQIVGEKLRGIRSTYGPEGIAFSTTTPSGTALSDSDDWIDRLIRLSGSPNWVSTQEICNWHRDSTHAHTVGTALPYPDWDHTEMVVLWGFNPTTVWLDQATQVAAARARGAKVMVIDPRRFGFGNGADHWLRVRPGADGILALGMMRRILDTGAYNKGFVQRWTNATFLIREDGEFLRGKDVGQHTYPEAFVVSLPKGELRFVRRNSSADASILECAEISADVVVTVDGQKLRCRTAFDHLREAAEAYTLEEVSELTWIPAEKIVAAADALGAAPSAAYYTWGGLGQHIQSSQIDRALATLMGLKGCFDEIGGNVMLPEHPVNKINGREYLDPIQLKKAVGVEVRPLGPPSDGRIVAHDFYTAVLESRPYPVRALIGFGSNLAVAHANSRRGRDAFRALDFYVHCDIFENPSSKYADILLPVNTQWERDALRVGFGSGLAAQEHVQYRHKLVDSFAESKPDVEIVMAIAKELGLADKFFNGDVDKGREWILEPLGITLNELKDKPAGIRIPLTQTYRKYADDVGDGQVRGFSTETGLLELYSGVLHRHGHPGVPKFDASQLPSNEQYPFVLTTAKAGHFCHSQHRQIPSLRKREKDPTVNIAPETGERLGLEPGDWTHIETSLGRITMRVKYDPTLDERVVRASYGWWQRNPDLKLPGYEPFESGGANYNLLVDTSVLDPVSGTSGHRSQSCRLIPVKKAPAWRGFVNMRVASAVKVVDDVTTVKFEALDDMALADYEPGQHLTVRIPHPETGEEVTRCYSLVGSALSKNRKVYQVAVRFVPPPAGRTDVPHGKMSGMINRFLKAGDIVQIKAPKGDFVPPTVTDRPVVLVAGGIGITPFLSYLETVVGLEKMPRIHLAYANRGEKYEAFIDRITELAARIPTLTITRYWSDKAATPPAGIKAGYVQTEDLLQADFPLPPEVYMCGPPVMTNSVRANLALAGHPPELVFEELFVAAAADVSKLPTGPFDVTFARSGKKVQWIRESGSLLELAEASGVTITNGCRAGQCESCEVTVTEGECLHRVDVSHPGGESCLACQAVPTSNVVIDA
jgi:anaerobic selenocysteine-containing dehydrogenase/ferredoxin-NADP reductase